MSQICVRPGCGRAVSKEAVNDPGMVYCPDCGGRLQPLTDPPSGGGRAALAPAGRRIAAYLLDFVIALVIGVVALIPIIGQFVGGLLLTSFWLFRDVNGGSPGKMATGLIVVNRTGGPSTVKQRILRNVPFAISIAPLIIPIVGYEVAAVLQLLALFSEIAMVLFTGERLTDRLVGTKVVRRSDALS